MSKLTPDDLARFIASCCDTAPGERELFANFCQRLQEWLVFCHRSRIVIKNVVGAMLPPTFRVKAGNGNKRYIIGLRLTPPEVL